MRVLPLYPERPKSPVEVSERLEADRACARCELGGQGALTTCMPADGAPGGLLVVGDAPTKHEAALGRPHTAVASAMVRRIVGESWRGPVAWTNALLCAPKPKKRTAVQVRKLVDACRPYLAQTVDEVRPTRILAMGTLAARALLGRSPDPQSVSGGHGWVTLAEVTSAAVTSVPVVILPSPGHVAANRFLRARFEVDLRAALVRDDASFGAPPWDEGMSVLVVEDGADAERAAANMDRYLTERGGQLVVDVETAGQLHEPELFVLLSVCVRALPATGDPRIGGEKYLWPMEALDRNRRRRRVLARLLSRWPVVAHGGKFDLAACRMWGFDFTPGDDTLLLRRLADAGSDASLEAVAELVGMGGHKEEASEVETEVVARLRRAVAASKKPVAKSAAVQARRDAQIAEIGDAHPIVAAGLARGWTAGKFGKLLLDSDVLWRYTALDVEATARAHPVVASRVAAEPGIQFVWDDVLKRATRAFARIEEWGVPADRDAVERFAVLLDARQADVLRRLSPYGGAGFNWRSTQQVADFLYGKLKLPCKYRTPGGAPSTDEQALAALRGRHPAADALIELRSLDKMRGTYADGGSRDDSDAPFVLGTAGLAQWILSDGRIHLNYNITGTETGRPSADSPNLLNQPRPTGDSNWDPGKAVRDIYHSKIGWLLYEFDQSQIEVRKLAALSGDEEMIRIFTEGRDIYLETAKAHAAIWKTTPEAITKEGRERQDCKVVVLSLAYQKGKYQLAEDLGCAVDHAERVIDAIMGRWHKFASWVAARKREVRTTGQVRTTWKGRPARRRWLTDVGWAGEDDAGRVAAAERAAVNGPAQGGASEYTMNAVIAAVEWIEAEGVQAEVSLTVYDSIVVHAPESMGAEVLHVVPRLMTSVPLGNGVPLVVDAKVGPRLGSLVKVKGA